MNFFAAQEKAKKRTTYLLFAFFVGLLVLLGVIDLFIIFVLEFFINPNPQPFLENIYYYSQNGTLLAVSGGVLAIVFIGIFYQSMKLSRGGKAVAEDLGAREIIKQSANIKELTLLNVVEEISLASGVPSPSVYVLDDDTINAFASGYGTEDSVVCATKGTLEKLNRQELQGVIAHEFSHIFNGDMRLSMRTSYMIFGMTTLGIVGYWIFRMSLNTRSRNSKNDSGKMAFLVLGLGIWALGYIGVFIGNIIKASISRQREFLADATAVKYTRDTSGIANALKKIGSYGSLINSSNASSYSHFYFAEGVESFFGNLFATHPPLKERILRVEPHWDGKFPDLLVEEDKKPTPKKDNKDKLFKTIMASTVLDKLNSSQNLDEKSINRASQKISKLPKIIIYMSENAFSSRALVLALLARDINEVSQEVTKDFAEKNPKLFKEVLKALNALIDIDESEYLTVLLLCIPSLKQLSLNQYKEFKKTLLEWIWANQEIVFFEWIVKRIVISQLDVYFEIRPKKQISTSEKSELAFFVSFLSLHESRDKILAKNLFDKTFSHEGLNGYTYVEQDELEYIKFGKCLDTLSLSDAKTKKRALKMAIYALSDDNEISTKNLQMLHALSLGLNVPLPLI